MHDTATVERVEDVEVLPPNALTLSELCDIANREHELAEAGTLTAVEHAFYCGQALIAAKEQMRHGEWLPWLERNFKASPRMAQNYARLAKTKRVSHLDEPQSIRQALKMLASDNKPKVLHNSGNNEWNTPRIYTDAAREVMGDIDLDPATNEVANAIIHAPTYYTQENDGLTQWWSGRVWMNPPYSERKIEPFVRKFIDHFIAGDISQGCVLVNNATETGWGQILLTHCSAVCFVKSRIKFVPANDETSKNQTGLQGQMILYFGTNYARFTDLFSEFGPVFGGHRNPVSKSDSSAVGLYRDEVGQDLAN
jgi:ParB family chromosome partitioning protein